MRNVQKFCARRLEKVRRVKGGGRDIYLEALEHRVLLSAVGLVAAYGFDEGTGSTVADASGLGNNGVISNTTWTAAGKYGGALSFNGTNSWVTINDSASLRLTTGMTLEAWVNPKTSTGYETVIMKERPAGLSYGLYASNNTNKPPAAYINTGGSDQSVQGASKLTANTWAFVSVTYDGAKLNVYINGTLSKSAAITGSMVTSSGALRIGGNSVWTEYFNGLIDNVRIYNRALSVAEMQSDMTTPVTAVADTTPPTITAKTPAANATNVATSTTLTATFSESVQAATVQWAVVDASNNAVAGTASYSDATHLATFTPSSPLAPGTQFTVTVSGAKDTAGNTLASPVTWSFTTAAPDTTPPTVTVVSPSPSAVNVLLNSTVTATFSEPIQQATINFVLRDSKSNLIPTTLTYNAATLTATLTPTSSLTNGTSYTAIVSGTQDLAGNPMADHFDWSFTTVPVGTGPFSIWPATATPVNKADADASSVELGVKFRADTSGYVTGVRFYKGSTNTGTHVGELWSSTGTLLATGTFTNETATGWQQLTFAQPVLIQANTTYVASYHTNVGHYAGDANFFATTGVDNGPLHALKNGVDGGDGVYKYGAAGNFPNQTYNSTNYWVDVVFTSAAVQGPQVTAMTPTSGSTNNGLGTTASATFNESVQPGSIVFTMRDSGNNPVAGSFVYNDANHTVTFTPTASLSYSSSYTATVSGATDLNGVVMASPVSWTFSTTSASSDPAVVGQWSAVTDWPLVAINQVLLKDGRILMWDGGPDCIGSSSARVYDPSNGTFVSVPVANPKNDNDIFCSGQVLLPDGRVLVVGGHDCTGVEVGTKHINIFDPSTMTWSRGPDMAYARWYPTATVLSDGKVLITAGSDVSNVSYIPVPELYDPATNTVTKLTAASKTIPNYPFVYDLPNGNVIAAGSDESKMTTMMLNVATQTWTTIDSTVLDAGSSVMYLPGKILKTGSSYYSNTTVHDSEPSANTAYVLDMTQSSPSWQSVSPMAYDRAHHNMTILPDGTVLVTGGSNVIGGVVPSTAVEAAELWNPTTETFSTMASQTQPRMYHSTSILLPDGRVISAGGGHNYVNNADYYNMEVYSPGYLFKGARPTITSSPTILGYGSNFFVGTPNGATIASVALVENGAVTHEVDMGQRYVPLSFTQTAGGLTVTGPIDANTAPPGFYMLFIVDSNGVPSIAPILSLPAPAQDVTPPSVPGNVVATGAIAGVKLTWAASTDNIAMAGYNIYRSTTSGFVPGPNNLVGQSIQTTYSDSVPGGTGTYYYVVKARDSSGNLSGPSAQVVGTANASPIHVIQKATNGNESSAAKITVTLPSAVTAGDFLIITGTAARPRHPIVITDSLGNTFVPAINAVSDPAQDVTAYVWYVANAKGGSDTFTLTPSGGSDALEIHVSEWTGINAANPVDQISSATGTGSDISSGLVTPTQDGELIFGYTFPNKSSTTGSGFTGLSYINGDLDEYIIQPTAASIDATFTQPADTWLALVATFRPVITDNQPPTAPLNPVATGGVGAVGLTWSASTDDTGVAGYNIYRSTVSGFVPSPANLIGQTAATSFTDTVAPGTYYYLIAARDGAGNISPPSTEVNGTATADTVFPTVSLSAPANGATVSGSVTVSAIAGDNVGVAGVQFLLDGNALGAEDTTAPYSVSWSSTSATNGAHTLTARVRDGAGNQTLSAPVTVTVSNTALPGLIASYNFNQGSGTTLTDLSGNGLNGTITNATWTTGHSGGALAFNGTNSWVTINDNAALHLTKGMTLEAWINTASVSGYQSIVLKERTAGLSYALYGQDNAGHPPEGYVNLGGSDISTSGGSLIPLNTWTHVATTFDGTTLRTYINGVLISSTAASGTLVSSTGALRIGGNSVWGEYFNGMIDDVRIYNRALSATEIQTDMNTPG